MNKGPSITNAIPSAARSGVTASGCVSLPLATLTAKDCARSLRPFVNTHVPRSIQALLDHGGVSTAMLHTHVLNRAATAIHSPAATTPPSKKLPHSRGPAS
jgi:hypothetical protein